MFVGSHRRGVSSMIADDDDDGDDDVDWQKQVVQTETVCGRSDEAAL